MSTEKEINRKDRGAEEHIPAAPVELADDILAGGEVLAHVPMLQEPGHLSGRKAPCFAPAALYALTRVQRTGIDDRDEDLWLTEEPLRRVEKGVITLLTYRFTHDALMYVTTGPSGSPRPDLVVRYDRALLARGVLDEVVVLRRTDGGEYEEVCRARPESEYVGRTDWMDVVRTRNQYLQELIGKRTVREGEYVALESGTEALETLMQERLARERLQRRTRREPIVASPVYARSEEEQSERARTAALQNALPAPRRARVKADSGDGEPARTPPQAVQDTGEAGAIPTGNLKRRTARSKKLTTSSPTRRSKTSPAPSGAGDSAPAPTQEGSGSDLANSTDASSASQARSEDAPSLGRALGGAPGFGLAGLRRVL